MPRDKRRAVAKTERIIAAYLLHRADSYETDDPIWVLLADMAGAIMEGEPHVAAKHGELDHIYYRVDSMRDRARKRQESAE